MKRMSCAFLLCCSLSSACMGMDLPKVTPAEGLIEIRTQLLRIQSMAIGALAAIDEDKASWAMVHVDHIRSALNAIQTTQTQMLPVRPVPGHMEAN